MITNNKLNSDIQNITEDKVHKVEVKDVKVKKEIKVKR